MKPVVRTWTLVILCTFIVHTSSRGDLIGYWPLDEGSGTTAVDVSGNGHDGELIGDTSWTDGMFGGGLEFDGRRDGLPRLVAAGKGVRADGLMKQRFAEIAFDAVVKGRVGRLRRQRFGDFRRLTDQRTGVAVGAERRVNAEGSFTKRKP